MLVNFLYKLSNIIIPSNCLNCNANTKHHLTLCIKCNESCIYCDQHCCIYCGLPVPPHPTEYMYYSRKLKQNVIKCDFCYEKRYSFDAIFCASIYGDIFSNLASRLKFAQESQNAKFFANHISQKLINQNLFYFDIVCCVPISYQRLFFRGYNQSALIAKFIYRDLKNVNKNLVFLPNLLTKTKHTKPQTKLSKQERMENVKDCFAVNQKLSNKFKNKTILIIDDIATTLSTIQECCKTLRNDEILNPEFIVASTFSRVDII